MLGQASRGGFVLSTRVPGTSKAPTENRGALETPQRGSGDLTDLLRLGLRVQPRGGLRLAKRQWCADELAPKPRSTRTDASDFNREVHTLEARPGLHHQQQRGPRHDADFLGQAQANAPAAQVHDGAWRGASTETNDRGYLSCEPPKLPALVAFLVRIRSIRAEETAQVIEFRIAVLCAGVQQGLKADDGGQETALRRGHTLFIGTGTK